MRRALLAVPWLLATISLTPQRALACATCGCGDPTLTIMGAEQPFEGRLRFSLEAQGRWDRLGAEGVDGGELREGRITLGASFAPSDRVVLSAAWPLVLRDVSRQSGARFVTLGPGDAEVRARFVLLRDRAFAPSHLFGPTLGLKLPTSLDQVGPNGELVPVDAQTGSGTVDPMFGLFYAHFADPWAVFASASVGIPLAGRYDESPGPSMRASVAGQYRLDRWITLRLGADARLDAPARVGEGTDPRSDHFSLFASPDLLWSPVSDWVLVLGARVPVLQISEQGREEGWYFSLAVAVDVS